MSLIQALKRAHRLFFLLLGIGFFAWSGMNAAQAAVAHDAASESHTGTTGSTNQASFSWTHTPAGTPRGVLVFVYTRSATQTVTSVTYGGVAMTQVSGGAAVDTLTEPGRVDTFFLGAGIPTGARPVVVNRTNNAVVMYAVAITQTAAADTAVTGIVLLQGDQALAQQSVDDGSTGVNSVRYAGTYSGRFTPPAAGANSILLHSIDLGAYGASTVRETTAGQGARLVGFAAVADDVAAVHLAVREFATTIATGTDPGATTIAPEAPATDVNQFTLRTDVGTETITSVTVNLSTNSGVARLAITDAANTELGFTTSPVAGSNTISVSGMSAVSGSATTFKVRITPLSHAAMPAPPGGAYAITAPVTSWAGDYARHAGSDTNTVALTIDNLSPAEVSGESGVVGSGQVQFSWVNPADADFSNVLVLRNTAAVADAPQEGNTTYAVGNTIGTSVVRYVLGGTGFTDTGLTNGTDYHYKIFTRDSNGNYSPGLVPTGSPFTPGPNCYAVASANWNVATTWSSVSGGNPLIQPCGGSGGIPDSSVSTFVGEGTTARNVTIPSVYAAQAANLTIGSTSFGTARSLTLADSTASLTVGGNLTVNKPNSNNTINALNVNAGTVTVGGNVTFGGTTNDADRDARIVITSGTLTIGGNLVFVSGDNDNNILDMSGGAGTVNLAGAFIIPGGDGRLTPGTGSTFNYNGTVAQTVVLNVGSVDYYNLHFNNTSASGATLNADITTGNVFGNVRVQSGTLNDGGFDLTGGAGDTFEVANGATFIYTTNTWVSGFSTRTFGATSTVEYADNGGQTVANESYGHLTLRGSGTKDLPGGTLNVAGNLSMSGTAALDHNSGTVNMNGSAAQAISLNATNSVLNNLTIANTGAGVTANSNVSMEGNFTNSGVFSAGTSTFTFNSPGNDQTITGATTFYNITLDNTNGTGTELTLNNDTTVNGTFSFLTGYVVTGANTLIIGNTTSCGVTGAGTGIGFVVGKLRKNFTVSLLDCTFEVGDGTNYTPVNVVFGSVSAAGGTVTAKATAGVHPQISTSSLDYTTPNLVNRYWMLTPADGLTFSDATLTFTPIGGSPVDHDDTANVGNYKIQRYEITGGTCDPADGGYTGAGSWNNTNETCATCLDQTTTSIMAGDISTFGSTCSHFAIGKGTISDFLREGVFIYQREVYY